MALTQVAGTPATAAAYNNLIPRIYEQTADQSLTTTPANSNVFTAANLTIGANEKWWCELLLDFGNFSTATNNIQLDWGAATGTVVHGRLYTIGPAGGSGSVTDGNGTFASRVCDTTVSYSGTASTSIRGAARQVFIVDGGASGGALGTLTLAMSAGTGTAYTGSVMIMHRVS